MPLLPAYPAHATTPDEAVTLLASHVVLDAREAAAFAAGHLAGAGRMSVGEFAAHRPELPPRTAAVLVVHDEPAEASRAAAALGALGYAKVRWLSAPAAALPGGHASTEAAVPLWRPSPFLEQVLGALPRGRSLDVAAGSGRESVFLGRHGFEPHAWDHDAGALERAAALAARHGVALRTRVVELERAEPPAGTDWDVVMVFRFLHRPLFAWLERAVAPGGALVYETFLEAQAVHGSPRQARFLLRPGELLTAFPGLVVERYEETAPEASPVMARLLARRPG